LGTFAVVGGGVVAALLLHSALESDDRFRIAGTSNIEIAGLDEVTRADVLPVFGEDIGKNIFFINLEERRHEIEAIPWVKHATVMRMLPNRLRVSIEERKPVAFTQINGETGLVDADGVLLTMSAAAMSERHYSFPDVSGLSATAKPDERHARMNVYMQMMNELDAGGQHNSLQISEVDLTDPDDAKAKMVEQGGDVVAHLGYERFLDRYQRYMRHIAEWRQQYPRLIGVDLRYKGQVVLKMAPVGAPKPGDANPQQVAADQKQKPSGQKPVQSAAGQSPASKASAQSRPQVAGKSAPKGTTPGAHGAAKQKNAATHGANSHGGKAKAERQKTDQTRADHARAEKQHKHEAARRAPMNTARHAAPAAHPVPSAAEGQ
jgi:cell division protein FtsQ